MRDEEHVLGRGIGWMEGKKGAVVGSGEGVVPVCVEEKRGSNIGTSSRGCSTIGQLLLMTPRGRESKGRKRMPNCGSTHSLTKANSSPTTLPYPPWDSTAPTSAPCPSTHFPWPPSTLLSSPPIHKNTTIPSCEQSQLS